MKNSIRHDVVVNMPYNLTHFLIENKCYSNFVNNVIDYTSKWNINKQHVLFNLKTIIAFYKIFRWRDTPEGHEYWSNLCKKYESICWNNLRKKYEQKTRNCKMA